MERLLFNWNRRAFLKASAATTSGWALFRLPVMAGPFTRDDFDHLVPADKKLATDWVKSLFARGAPETLRDSNLSISAPTPEKARGLKSWTSPVARATSGLR